MEIIDRRPWTSETTSVVLSELGRQSIYLTNLVKCAQPHPEVPARRIFGEDMPLFAAELALVRPKRIVAFGQLTFSILTGESIKLRDYRREIARKGIRTEFYFRAAHVFDIPVFPSYFPVGRGNPRLAAEVLSLIRDSTSPDLQHRVPQGTDG